VVVGHREDVGVADVDFVLAEAPFAFGVFDGDAGQAEVPADGGGEELFSAALKEVVVFEVPAEGVEFLVVLFVGGAVGLAVGEVFEFGGGQGVVAEAGGGGDLFFEDGAGGDGDVVDIAVDEGGLGLPGGEAEGGEVGEEVEVAVAEFPVGEAVAGDGLHFGVGGEEVVAGVGAMGGDVIEEEGGVEAFAHESAVVIGEGGDDGFNGTGVDELLEGGEIEMGHGAARVSLDGNKVNLSAPLSDNGKKVSVSNLREKVSLFFSSTYKNMLSLLC